MAYAYHYIPLISLLCSLKSATVFYRKTNRLALTIPGSLR
jgi:hypothetical protein